MVKFRVNHERNGMRISHLVPAPRWFCSQCSLVILVKTCITGAVSIHFQSLPDELVKYRSLLSRCKENIRTNNKTIHTSNQERDEARKELESLRSQFQTLKVFQLNSTLCLIIKFNNRVNIRE